MPIQVGDLVTLNEPFNAMYPDQYKVGAITTDENGTTFSVILSVNSADLAEQYVTAV